jgi:hypothetical protein
MKRILVTSVAAAATTTIQVPNSGTIREVSFSIVTAAAGSWELSKSSTSQIATTAPDVSVLARSRIGATAGNMQNRFELNVPVKTLDYLYIHTTGAGNVGEAVIRID